MQKKVIWSDESSFHHILDKWVSVHQVNNCGRHFAGRLWVHLSPERGRATAKQFKVALSENLYPTMNHFYPDGNDLFQVDTVMPPSVGRKGLMNGLMSVKIT